MSKCCLFYVILWCFMSIIVVCFAANTQNIPREKDNNNECHSNSVNSNSLYCRGSRALRNAISNLSKSDKPLVIMRGLELVPSKHNISELKSADTEGNDADSFVDRISDYLRTHELNIKFSDLLPDESENALGKSNDKEFKNEFQGV